MDLYLMRHGIAFDHGEWSGSDFDRPLTERGRERAEKILSKLKKTGELAVDAIWSSPLVRARQTAEIAGDVLGLPVNIVDALECGAALKDIVKYAKSNPPPARLLCVGHEPDCGEIVGELVGDESSDYSFKRAGIARLSGELKAGGMKLRWLYAPKDVLDD
jgi:phosphohistidine phosphatase